MYNGLTINMASSYYSVHIQIAGSITYLNRYVGVIQFLLCSDSAAA
jgi:hypothetical protein